MLSLRVTLEKKSFFLKLVIYKAAYYHITQILQCLFSFLLFHIAYEIKYRRSNI